MSPLKEIGDRWKEYFSDVFNRINMVQNIEEEGEEEVNYGSLGIDVGVLS